MSRLTWNESDKYMTAIAWRRKLSVSVMMLSSIVYMWSVDVLLMSDLKLLVDRIFKHRFGTLN